MLKKFFANISRKKIRISAVCVVLVVLASFTAYVFVRNAGFSKVEYAAELTQIEKSSLESLKKSKYPDRHQILTELPYNLKKTDIELSAESAILIDTNTGNILFENNADEIIPPASMTKLFVMYIVDEEISAGNFSYDQIIPLPEESLACNMPPHSSLMFLGEGQKVTLEELLLGLSICSGNDAAYAIAYTISGSMENFIDRMNEIAKNLGLEHTHFVESSGYSELNQTTAREMAEFSRVYLQKHPDSLKLFHSVTSFTYPKEHNMADGDVYQAQDWSNGLPRHITMGITQKNTNPLLGKLEGCDGLKTGYIDESGYNLSLTAQRDGTRFLSVTMRGQGNNAYEGNQNRILDGTKLMEWAFSSFADFSSFDFSKSYVVKTYGNKQQAVNLVPGFDIDSICVPFIYGSSIQECEDNVKVELNVPQKIYGKIEEGKEYGYLSVKLNDFTIDTIPLIADRTSEEANFITRFADAFIY